MKTNGITPRRLALLGLSGVLLAAAAGGAHGQLVNYFRHDRGIAADDNARLPATLDDAHLAWKQPLPPGHSTPLVAGDRIFLTAHEGNDLATICLDRASGEVQWKQLLHVDNLEKVHNEGSPASATAACDGRRLYVFFGSYGLACYDLQGTPVWTKKLGPFRDEFGAASSPIVVDDKVILNEDHDLDSFILAVRADTGDTVWQTPRDGFTRSYATPVVWDVAGKKQIVMAGTLELVAYDVSDGRPLWSLDGLARIVNSTPVQAGSMLYVNAWSPGGDSDARIAMEPWQTALELFDKSKNGKIEKQELPAGEVQSRFFRIDLNSDQALDEPEWTKYARLFELAQNTLVALRPGEDGKPPTAAWEYQRGLPYVPSPTVYRGLVYLIKDSGILTILDAETGKLVKQARTRGSGNYYASPAAGDGKLYLASTPGIVTVLKADKTGETLFTRDFNERIAATPVLDNGRVYIRTGAALYCFEEKRED